jgi:GNAT superfamily N-acetyltransferase
MPLRSGCDQVLGINPNTPSSAGKRSDAALPPTKPLAVEFRCGREAPTFVETYLDRILWPGIADPIDSGALFNTDFEFLAQASATIAIGWAEADPASGLYVTTNPDVGMAWLHGVRVDKPWRGLGYGSRLVRAACLFVKTSFKINRIALAVRCNDDGQPRQEAYRTYLRCGFGPAKTHTVIVSGERCDRHFGPIGMKFFSLEMQRAMA